MLVDDNTLEIFRRNVQTVYEIQTGLTPTEMAMRINQTGSSIKNALTLRTAQLSEAAATKKFTSTGKAYEKGVMKSIGSTHGTKSYTAEEPNIEKSLDQEAKQDQTKRVAQESRRGSVRWDTMEQLNNQTSPVMDKNGEKIEMGSNSTTNLSFWVPMEYYDTRYIYGKPKIMRGGK